MTRRYLPYVAFAVTMLIVSQPQHALAIRANLSYAVNVTNSVSNLISVTIPIVVALALVAFVWGLVVFMLSPLDADQRMVGRRRMIWGILTLFVIVSIWGLVSFMNIVSGIMQGTVFTPPDSGL